MSFYSTTALYKKGERIKVWIQFQQSSNKIQFNSTQFNQIKGFYLQLGASLVFGIKTKDFFQWWLFKHRFDFLLQIHNFQSKIQLMKLRTLTKCVEFLHDCLIYSAASRWYKPIPSNLISNLIIYLGVTT